MLLETRSASIPSDNSVVRGNLQYVLQLSSDTAIDPVLRRSSGRGGKLYPELFSDSTSDVSNVTYPLPYDP